jgi:hypothetical protein
LTARYPFQTPANAFQSSAIAQFSSALAFFSASARNRILVLFVM